MGISAPLLDFVKAIIASQPVNLGCAHIVMPTVQGEVAEKTQQNAAPPCCLSPVPPDSCDDAPPEKQRKVHRITLDCLKQAVSDTDNPIFSLVTGYHVVIAAN